MNLMKSPKSIDIAITDRCNLRCRYCSHFTSAGNVGKDLHKNEWLRFFKELNHCSVMRVCLQGAEPFYREDLKEIIGGVVKNRMRFSILSNGTLITEEKAKFLSSTKRCDHVQVSIDGSNPKTHDSMRGEGSFLKAIEGIKNLKKHKVPVTVRVTIHRQNFKDLNKIAELLFEDIGLNSFSTNEASYMGICRQNYEQVQLNVEEYTTTMETLLRLNKKYNNRITATAGPLANVKDWIMMEKARCEDKKSLPNRGYLTGCGGPMSNIAVRADGVIIPCIQLSHIELGRINKDSLLEIWQNHLELKNIRKRHNIPLHSFKFCKGCAYINYCTGNCPALAYELLGDINQPAPDACLKRFLEKGGKLPDKNLLIN